MTADKRKDYYSKETVRRVPLPFEKPIEFFHCRQCGKLVEIFDRTDKRTVYCSRACEKKYWRHQSANKRRDGNNGMSGGMSLGNLIRRERRNLD